MEELDQKESAEFSGAELAQELEASKSAEALVVEKLIPSVEYDQAGYERKVYHYGDVSFTFRGREELPIIPQMKEKGVEVLAKSERPGWVPPVDFEQYQLQLRDLEQSEQPLVLTNKTIQGVLELVVKLGGDAHYAELAAQSAKREYPPETLAIIDQIMAVSLMDDEGKTRRELDQDAEALVVLSLLGDSPAKRIIAARQEALDRSYDDQEYDRQQRSLERAREKLQNVEAASPKELIAIHATDYEPEVLPDGSFAISLLGDATEGKMVRNTLHFTLNHKVESHVWGNWESRRFLVLAPLDEMIKANGAPRVLEGVDTWWVSNPGEKIVLKNATLVELVGEQEGIIEEDGNRIRVKSEGITSHDFESLQAWAEEHEMRLDLFGLIKVAVNGSNVEKPGHALSLIEELSDPQKVEQSIELQRTIAGLISDMAIRKVMKGKGYRYIAGGPHYIQDGEMQSRINKLGKVLGQKSGGLHSNTPEGQYERRIFEGLGRAFHRDTTGEPTDFHWEKYDPEGDFEYRFSGLFAMPPQTRRAFYAAGMTVAHPGKVPDQGEWDIG